MSFDFSILPPSREGSLTQQIQVTLQDSLRSGLLRPMDRTSIRDLAERLGVSTMPVREAVSRLVAQGALSVERNRAVVVPRLSVQDFQDLTEVRVLTESDAARRAALRIDAESLDELRRLNATFEEAMAGKESGNPVRINRAFHFRLYDLAGSPALSRVIAANWLLAGPIINLDIGLASRRRRNANSLECHAAILDALAEGDAEAAAAALALDIRTASQFIIETAFRTGANEEGTAS